MADEHTEIDDWLSDLEDEDNGDEVNQDDIDQLLGGDDTGAAEEPADAADTTEAPPGVELSQDDIDGLLGETAEAGQEPEAAAEPEPTAEEPAAIGEEPEEEEAAVSSDEEISAADLDQSEIDALFASAEEETAPAEEMDIDQLFGGDEDTGLTSAEPPPIDTGEEPTVTAPPPSPESVAAADATATAAEVPSEDDTGPDRRKWLLPLAAGFLIVLLVGGTTWWFMGRPTAPPPEQAEVPAEPTTPPPPPAPNTPPVAVTAVHRMDKAGGALDIELEGRDADGDQLVFELVSPPSHGRLSGAPPALTYLPDATFTGEDSFSFVVSDGTQKSEPATVFILGRRPPAKVAEAKPATPPKPKPEPAPVATDVQLSTDSTQPLLIDWRRIWNEANPGRLTGRVEITTATDTLHGRLVPLTATTHRYEPPAYFSGEETIGYRFVVGKRRSAEGLLRITVRPGDHRPEPRIVPLAKTYPAGSTVIVDARPSRDDQPERLSFSWQQVSGPPVRIEPRTTNQAVVAFIMPTDFGAPGPEISLVLTVTDAGGQTASADIVVRGRSRRTAALWNLPPED